MSKPKTDKAAIRQIIRTVRHAGWELVYVSDGEEGVPTRTEREALDAVTARDQAHLVVRKPDEVGWVFFVLGNDPEEVASDYTINLTEPIEAVTDKWED